MPLESSDLVALSRLLDQALDLEPSQAQAWLDALPDEHRHLAPRLRDMLAEHRRTDDAAFLAQGPRLDDKPADALGASAGGRVGPYRLIREIGRGGMGLVWLAERADGSLKRQVALKLPRLVWGAGLPERMARERDIGALLEHPHIARLYDAGVDALERPYLAFEYIDGQAIDAWCRAHALPVPARLRLFVQVARAVAYAHGRLVVHRDLKPSNVLVTADGHAHLLDFGIAKLLDDAAASPGGLTQEQGRVLTPHYASPEQLRGEAITVASDVYSLGVLLFELLTGHTPHEAGKGFAAMEQAMLQGEAPLASSRADGKALARALRGEVDAILAKALQREPSRRYATADALADDIQRHLDGERVLAQPDRMHYRVAKAVRRHRVLFAAASAVLVAVLGGAAVSIVQARRAQDAAERARVVKEFVVDVFKVNERGNPLNAELRQLPAEVMLERGAKLIATKFAADTTLQAELYGVVAGIFLDMGASTQAEMYAQMQVGALQAAKAKGDEHAAAWALLSEALAQQNKLPGAEQAARKALEWTDAGSDAGVRARLALVDVLLRESRDTDALSELDRIDADLKRQGREASLLAVKALDQRAFLLNFQRGFDAALPVYEQMIEMALAADGPWSRLAIRGRLVIAREFIHRGQFERAKGYMVPALAALRQRGGIDELGAVVSEALLTTEMAMSKAAGRRGISLADALSTLERLRAEMEAKGPSVPVLLLARVRFNQGVLHLAWGDVQRAHALIEPAVGVLRTGWAGQPWAMQMTSNIWGYLEMHRGEHLHADALFREAIDWQQRARRGASGEGHVDLARNFGMQGRFADAEAELSAATAPKGSSGQQTMPPPDEAGIPLVRAQLELDRGDFAAALAWIPELPADADVDDYRDPRLLRGAALCGTGQVRQGLPLLEEQLSLLGREFYIHDPRLARWRAIASLCAWRGGERQRARELFDLSRAAFTAQSAVSPYFKAPLIQLAVRLGNPAAPAR